MCMKNKLTIVRTVMSDDSDYSFIYENAIHNTLAPYWAWASENNLSISFEKHTDHDISMLGLRLAVVAEFPSPTELVLFKLTFGKFPLTNINQSLEKPHYF